MRPPYQFSSFLGEISEEDRVDVFLLILITLAALAIPLLPLDLVSNNPSPCIFKMIFGYPCPGCGMTRAFWALLHGDIVSAFGFNWKIIFVAPILGALYFYRVSLLSEFSPFLFLRNKKRRGEVLS